MKLPRSIAFLVAWLVAAPGGWAALIRMDVLAINETAETASGTVGGVGFSFAGLNAPGPGERGLVDGWSVINSGLNVFNTSAFYQPAPQQDALCIQFADNFRFHFDQVITGLYLDVADLQFMSSVGNILTFEDQSRNPLSFRLMTSNGLFTPDTYSLGAVRSGSTLANGTLFFDAPLTELYILSTRQFSDGGYLNIGTVPEPGAAGAMLGVALLPALTAGRWRRSRARERSAAR